MQDIREPKQFSPITSRRFFLCIDSILISSHLHSSVIHYWYYDFLKLIFLVNGLNQEWVDNLGGKWTKRQAAREVLQPSDELPISQMCPNVARAHYLILGRAFTAANKMFIRCIPRWRDIYQHVDASPATNCRCKAVHRFLGGASAGGHCAAVLPPSLLLLPYATTDGSIAWNFFSKALLPAC